MGPQNDVFGGNGGRNLRFWFCDPPKGTSLLGTRRIWGILCQIGAPVSAAAFFKNQKIAESLCAEGPEITHAQNQNP